MKIKSAATLFFMLIVHCISKAQVWYPEGVYLKNTPSLITVDKHVITVTKLSIDALNSYWQVNIHDGQSWVQMPILTLNKTAELTDIKLFKDQVYISGNFMFENTFNGIVRFTGKKWEGLGSFKKSNFTYTTVLTMDVQNGKLAFGGSFFFVNGDSLSHLAKFDGAKFSPYFENCKSCNPDNTVTDIVSNDSVTAISGLFTSIRKQKSKYLYRITNGVSDTFINTPRVLEKLALDGFIVFASGGVTKDKKIYRIAKTIIDINSNLDSAFSINEMLIHDGKLVVNGVFDIKAGRKKVTIIRFDNSTWTDISNNYSNAIYIATGRSTLFAIGHPEKNISIWNPNKAIVRFFPGMSLVRAKAFLDLNNDCIMDKGEIPLSKQYIKLPFLNKGVFTNENGMAEFLVPNVVQNTLRFVIKPFRNFVRANCADTSVTRTFVPGTYLDSIQFPLQRVPNINDIRVSISSPKGIQVVQNKKVTYHIRYENIGSTIISGKIRLNKNPLFTEEVTEPKGTDISASSVEWNYNNLPPGGKGEFVYIGYAKDPAFANDLQFEASASSSISSGTSPFTQDDTDSIPQTVSGVINPFRKDVYPNPDPGDSITYLDISDRDLRYHISFNNFSTDTVFYAVIIDTLDLNLDMSYIQETGSNKSYYTEVQTDPNNQYKGILIWHFPNIRLAPNPTMNFENLSSGSYIGFKVVTKPLSEGYFIKNTASVFYDNTYAGSTNAVYCTIAPTGLEELFSHNDLLSVFPNPFTGKFTVNAELHAGDVIEIYNSCGQLISNTILLEQTSAYEINLDQAYQSGMYFIHVNTGASVLQAKVLKY